MAYREWRLAALLPLSSMRVKVLMQHGWLKAMYIASFSSSYSARLSPYIVPSLAVLVVPAEQKFNSNHVC